MSCANNVLPVYMWPSPGKIPEALCLPPVQVDTVHFSSEATETNGFSRLSSSLNRTAVIWVINKHKSLRRYVDISRGARKKFLGEGNAGATYIDLFCGTGRARIRETGAWIDGSAVSAWKIAQGGRAPFSEILVADIDQTRRT